MAWFSWQAYIHPIAFNGSPPPSPPLACSVLPRITYMEANNGQEMDCSRSCRGLISTPEQM